MTPPRPARGSQSRGPAPFATTRMTGQIRNLLAALAAGAFLFATAHDALAAQQETRPGATKTRSAYVIGVNDQIAVRVADNPELSDRPQRVDLNGEVKLPMVGRVQAAGLTTEQLEAELTSRFKVFLNEPEVIVTVAESHSQPVSVVGAVQTPGVRQLDGQKTLIEVLLLVGGVTAEAGPTVTVTRRLEHGRIPLEGAKDDRTGQFSTADLDVRALLDGRAPASDILLQPNDIIAVSRAQRVFVIGEVGQAGPVTLVRGNSISVLEAVSSSGGVLRTAAASRARILRAPVGDETAVNARAEARTEVPVDIKKIMAGKADDVALRPGDILVVPDSTGKRATTRAIEAAIQAGLMFGSYGLIR